MIKWRLVLGPSAGGPIPDARLAAIDRTLSFVYDASLAPSAPSVPADLAEWLAKIREFFPKEVVALVQNDAIERKNLRRLLFEPEALATLDRNIDLVKTLLAAKELIPARARDVAREIVREVAAKLRAKLETSVRTAVVGALRRNRRSAIPVYRNIDWKRTIERNLRHWLPDRKVLVPERFHFSANELRRREWKVILLVDQSGSMAASVIYSSVIASVLASLDVVKTHLVLFDTSIADLTPHLADPVDLLFGARLGGGTDIAQAVEYGQGLVEAPERTLFVLITDLYEGGDREVLLRRLATLVESRVKTLCVLALSDDARASYDADLAREVAALGVHTFASTPGALVDRIGEALR